MSFDLKNFNCFGFKWTLLLNDCSILSVLKSSPDDLSMEYNYTLIRRNVGGVWVDSHIFTTGMPIFNKNLIGHELRNALNKNFKFYCIVKKICDIPLLVPDDFFCWKFAYQVREDNFYTQSM